MDLPDKSQWDETTCDLAGCQHPQCWATIRRIERGHPRLLDSSSKSFLDAEGELASPVSSLTRSLNCFYLAPSCHVVCFLLVWSFRQAPSAYHCKHRRFLLPGQGSYLSASLTRIYLHKGSLTIEFKVWLQVWRQVNNRGIFLKRLNTSKLWVNFLCLCTELWESQIKNKALMRNALEAQGVELGTFTAVAWGSIPGQGIKIPQTTWETTWDSQKNTHKQPPTPAPHDPPPNKTNKPFSSSLKGVMSRQCGKQKVFLLVL